MAIGLRDDSSDGRRFSPDGGGAGASSEVPRLLDAVFDALPDVIGILDTSQRVVRYNRAGYELLGKKPEDVVGRRCYELLGREFQCDDCPTVRCLESGEPCRTVRHVAELDKWIDVRVFPVTGEGGRLLGVVEHVRDITEQRVAEEMLRQSEARYRTLFEGAGDAILLLDGYVFVDCNKAAASLFGCGRDEIIGKGPMDFSPPSQADGSSSASAAMRKIDRALSGKETVVFDWTHQRKDGSIFLAEVKLSKLPGGAGGRNLAIVRDITERRKSQEEKAHLQRLESLGVFAGGIAHDFNNLLTTISGNTELALLDRGLSQATRKKLGEVLEAGRRAAELCRQILDYSGKGRSGKLRLNLVERAGQLVGLLRSSLPRKTSFDMRLPAEPIFVLGDPAQIDQILMNLVTNAAEAYQGSSGVVGIELGTCSSLDELHARQNKNRHWPHWSDGTLDGPCCFIEVTDAGAGIREADFRRIFEPFYSTKFLGRGLGLSSVLGIVRSHGGAVSVRSMPGQGTIFLVCLPLCDIVGETAGETRSVDVGPGDRSGTGNGCGGTRSKAPADGYDVLECHGMKVLVVDDEETVLATAVSMLGHLGFHVVEARDAKEALAAFERLGAELDLAMIDIGLRDTDGTELASELRRLGCSCPIVLSSGYDGTSEIARGGSCADGFIQKPFTFSELLKVLRLYLPSGASPE